MNEKEFSQRYLNILSDYFPLNKTELSVTDRIDRTGLRNDLRQLFDLHTESALDSIRTKDPDRTAFHFGPSETITETLKCAPIYTDHVVTQDLLFRQLRYGGSVGGRRLDKRLFETAKEVTRWQELIDRRDVSIVPHPIFWESEFRKSIADLDSDQQLYSAPIYAEATLGVTPMTDSMVVSQQFYEVVKNDIGDQVSSSVNRDEFEEGNFNPRFLVERLEGYGDELYKNKAVIDLVPRLLRKPNERTVAPEVPQLDDLDAEMLEQRREQVKGFRNEIYTAVGESRRAANVDELDEIINVLREDVRDEYRRLARDVRGSSINKIKQGVLSPAGVAVTSFAAHVVYGLTINELHTVLTAPETYLRIGSATAGAGFQSILDSESTRSRENPIFQVFNSTNRSRSSVQKFPEFL